MTSYEKRDHLGLLIRSIILQLVVGLYTNVLIFYREQVGHCRDKFHTVFPKWFFCHNIIPDHIIVAYYDYIHVLVMYFSIVSI